MISISFEPKLQDLVPQVRLGCISCDVQIEQGSDLIDNLAKSIIEAVRSDLAIEKVSQKPAIKSTKEAYRTIGKDPSRYRPSAEALTRRVVNGKDLYRINNVVDVLNLISLESGFSIGGYDTDKIEGEIEFGIGKHNEPYSAIGRGKLNIENLPVFRDSKGAFGSPTSDSLRTMVTENTTNFLMVIIEFGSENLLEKTMERSIQLYTDVVKATNIDNQVIIPTKK